MLTKVFAIAGIAAMTVCADARALTIDLTPFMAGEAITARIDLHDVTAKDGRCHLDATLIAPDLWSDLDAKIVARGNLNSSRNRLYWVGPTRLRGIGQGNRILLTSRARYESWVIVDLFGKKMKTRTFRDTKAVDFVLQPVWDADANRLSLAYEIENIRNVPGEIERALRRMGVEFGGTTTLRIPRDTVALDPRIEAPLVFAAAEKGLRLSTTVSIALPPVELFLGMAVDSCTTLKGILYTLPERLASFAIALIGRLRD